jgi:hypothetical protein
MAAACWVRLHRRGLAAGDVSQPDQAASRGQPYPQAKRRAATGAGFVRSNAVAEKQQPI